MTILVTFLEHRIEYLKDFFDLAKRGDIIILEEPDFGIIDLLSKDILDIDFYIDFLYSEFSEYLREQYMYIKELVNSGKIVLQVEPYLTKLVELYHFIEMNIFNDALLYDDFLKYVHSVENYVSKLLIEYYDTILNGTFEEAVNAVIKFAKADAFRIYIRDLLRCFKICEIVNDYGKDVKYVVEAGLIHKKISSMIERICKDTTYSIDVKDVRARKLGIILPTHPGYELTYIFLEGQPFNEYRCRDLAAKCIVYTLAIKKQELRPLSFLSYPHLIDEYRVLEFVNKLNYDMCRRIYEKYRKSILR